MVQIARCRESDDDIPLSAVKKRKVEDFPLQSETKEMHVKIQRLARELSSAPCVEFPADRLFEYCWPDDGTGEYYLLQEHVCEYLNIKSFQRRFPHIICRPIGAEERDFLLEKGAVTDLQCSLGLTAIKTEDACEIMASEFVTKYQEYLHMVHKREMQKIVCEQEAQRATVTSKGIPHFMKRALKETARYNSVLNRERREERSAYFDLQTQVIHYPQKPKTYDLSEKEAKTLYPVALMTGQYQEYYRRYSSDELNQMPLRTVLTPLKVATGDPNLTEQEPVNAEAPDEQIEETVEDEAADVELTEEGEEIQKDPFCGICMKGPEMNKKGLPENLIHCSQCVNSGHPTCLDMTKSMVKVIQTYEWQCMECKICTECLAPHDEDEMMFCDNCDRGYHSYCVGLKDIPNGRWVCSKCGKCSSCLCDIPHPDGGTQRWKNEMTKPQGDEEAKFLQIHCHACSKLFRKGDFCPVCLKVYRSEEDPINPMVCCDNCDRWIHTDCDGIDEQRYKELSNDCKSSYTCILCRGEREERMDAFHKKNRQ